MKAIIVNRNLLSTLKKTVEFLSKESRIDVIIYDQQSTYPPLLEYYKTCGVEIVYSNTNGGPHSVWGNDLKHHLTDYFIIADSDCSYEGVPDDWLDVMLNIAKNNVKVGFSLDLDLPETPLRQNIIEWESKFWVDKNEYGWIADIDTTFALYPPNSPFTYRAIRLDKPYCIKHIPWYLNKIPEEWKYYLDHASSVSSWGSKLKKIINMNTVTKFEKSFNVVNTELNSKFWVDHYEGWENSTFEFIIPYLNKDKTFIDIGSWIGPISLLASQFSKQCICFEPDGIAYNEFKQNIELNNIENIYLENVAVSIHSEIEIGSDILGESITRDSCKTNVIKCKCVSIKDILDKYNLSEEDISVIKIDVEGHETELLKDKTLWDLNVPMHISFHPGWKEDKEYFFNSVIPFLEHKKIDISNLESFGNFFDLTIK